MNLTIPKDASDVSEDVPSKEDTSESFPNQEKDRETAALVTADSLPNVKADFDRRKADFHRRKADFQSFTLPVDLSIPKDAPDASEDVPSEEDTSKSVPNQEKNSETTALVTADLQSASTAGAGVDMESIQVTAKERKEARKMRRKKRQNADVVTKPASKTDRLELAPGVESSKDITPLHNAIAADAANNQAFASIPCPRPPSLQDSLFASSSSSLKPGAVRIGGSESDHHEWTLQTLEEPDTEQGSETRILPIAAEVALPEVVLSEEDLENNKPIAEAQIVETAKVCGQPRWLIFALLAVVVAAAIGAGLGVRFGSGGDDPPIPDRPNELEKVLGAIIPSLEIGSSHGEAFNWLANEDPAFLDFETTPSRTILERYVIATLYYSLNGPDWEEQLGFLSEESVCKWNITNAAGTTTKGVACNEDKFVVEINLWENELTGNIPSEVGLLTTLEELDLRENQLTGKIPSELGLLTNLTFVDLSKFLYVSINKCILSLTFSISIVLRQV
jgi:hypothetical protein